MKTIQKGKSKPEVIVNNEPKLLASFKTGDVSHQGDIIIVCIGKLPANAVPRQNRQLVDGSTQGSRHVLERGDVYDCDPQIVAQLIEKAAGVTVPSGYIGPVFVSPADPTPYDLTHPEHGHQGFEAGSVCAVVYQRNLDAEQREVRSRD
jgi:hypothetical protein